MTASPTARALRVLELLQTRPGITADQLAERLGVSPRAVRRYVEILRDADVPVLAARGPAGGYRLGRGTRLPPLVFDRAEALALVMAALDGHHDPADADQPVGRALGKLLRALPEAVTSQANLVRLGTSTAPTGRNPRPDPDVTVVLAGASEAHRCVQITYRSGAGHRFTAVVEPWAVVVRRGLWYLLCRRRDRDEVRTYRVDRIVEADVTNQDFQPPAVSDAAALLEEHLSLGWAHEVEVVVSGPLTEVAPWVPRTMGRLEAIDDAETRLVGSTNNPGEYAADLARIPFAFRILGGPELRAAAASLAERLATSAYSSDR